MKVFSHDASGRFFPSKDQAKSWNPDNPDALLYSILDQIENYRKDGVFHVRLCIPEFVSQYDFPCNEWKQSSNFVETDAVTDFEAVELTYQPDEFAGLALTPTRSHTLVAMQPGGYWFAIGCQYPYNWGIYGPKTPTVQVHKMELYLAVGRVRGDKLNLQSLLQFMASRKENDFGTYT